MCNCPAAPGSKFCGSVLRGVRESSVYCVQLKQMRLAIGRSLRHPTSSGARLNRSKDYTEATAAPVAYYGLLDASGGQVGARRLPRHQVCSAVLVAAGDSGKLALSHLRVGNDTLSPSRSSLAIVSHMCGSAGSSQHRASAAERAMPGGRGPFLQVAFFLITAFGQATLNQVRLGQASCVDPRPK